jgi:phage terminase large subunit GpA-like protein
MPNPESPVTCADTGEVVTSYEEYLRSRHWANVRRCFKSSRSYTGKCAVCGFHSNLQLHHKSYERLGRERERDLVHLCDKCHSKTHDLYNKKQRRKRERGKVTLWNAHEHIRGGMGKPRKVKARNKAQARKVAERGECLKRIAAEWLPVFEDYERRKSL